MLNTDVLHLTCLHLLLKSLKFAFVTPADCNVCVCVSQSGLRSERDYESVVLMRLRQAEERKRLIEEMKRQEEEDETA